MCECCLFNEHLTRGGVATARVKSKNVRYTILDVKLGYCVNNHVATWAFDTADFLDLRSSHVRSLSNGMG